MSRLIVPFQNVVGMDKVGIRSWPFHFFLVLVLWGATVNLASAAGPELQVITESAPPISFIDARGNLSGLAVEVVQAIQKEIGFHAEIQLMPWARGYHELTTRPNVALFPTTRTLARENLFHWVGPVFTTRWIMYARKGSGLHITCLEDAKSIDRIGVYRGDARAQLLRDNGFDNLDIADRQELNLAKLLGGRVDAILYSDLTLKNFLAKTDTDPEQIEAVFEVGSRDLYIAFSLDSDPEIIHAWQAVLDRLEERGDVQCIRDKWLP